MSQPNLFRYMLPGTRCATCYAHKSECLGHAHPWRAYSGEPVPTSWIVVPLLLVLVGGLIYRVEISLWLPVLRRLGE